MARFRVTITALLVVGFAAATAATTYASRSDDGNGSGRIAMEDDCDPRDSNWNMVGGCQQRRGNVTLAEFDGELDSPLAAAVIGHQAWRNDPSYLVLRAGKTLRVTNQGGRPHTFTKVAAFGGGKIPVPPLNEGLVMAPECPASVDIAPGGSTRISGLAVGNHRFMCCIHPWMRALVKVQPRSSGGDHDDDD
jgi:plastocyanin